jgi:hypothetical protein
MVHKTEPDDRDQYLDRGVPGKAFDEAEPRDWKKPRAALGNSLARGFLNTAGPR